MSENILKVTLLMVRSSSQIGMACAAMERPQKYALKPRDSRNFFLSLTNFLVWQSR